MTLLESLGSNAFYALLYYYSFNILRDIVDVVGVDGSSVVMNGVTENKAFINVDQHYMNVIYILSCQSETGNWKLHLTE